MSEYDKSKFSEKRQIGHNRHTPNQTEIFEQRITCAIILLFSLRWARARTNTRFKAWDTSYSKRTSAHTSNFNSLYLLPYQIHYIHKCAKQLIFRRDGALGEIFFVLAFRIFFSFFLCSFAFFFYCHDSHRFRDFFCVFLCVDLKRLQLNNNNNNNNGMPSLRDMTKAFCKRYNSQHLENEPSTTISMHICV